MVWQGSAGDRRPYADQSLVYAAPATLGFPILRSLSQTKPSWHRAASDCYERPDVPPCLTAIIFSYFRVVSGDTVQIGPGVVDERYRLLELQCVGFSRNGFCLRDDKAMLSHVDRRPELAAVRF